MADPLLDIEQDDWLAALVEREVRAHDPVAARLRIPPELRDAASPLDVRARMLATRSLRRPLAPPGPGPEAAREAFLARIAGHVQLVLEVAILAGRPFEARRRTAEVATLLTALNGLLSEALAADPGPPPGGDGPPVERALVAAGRALRLSGWPPGDPVDGLPLSSGQLAVERRLLARLASAYYRRGRLDAAEVRRRRDQSGRALCLLAETLAAHAAAAGRLDARRRRVAERQVAQWPVEGTWERRLRDAIRAPRGATAIARQAPPRLRTFLVEEMLLAEASGAPSAEGSAFADALAAHASVPAEALRAMRAEAALRAAAQLWLGPSQGGAEWQAFADQWGDLARQLAERVTQAVTDNLDAIVREVRQTGELGQLLAKAAAGTPLSDEEKKKVKVQLLDLAKAVPALAIFAAPGGMLLLPLLVKLLPFNVLPSAWDSKPPGKPEPAPGGQSGGTKGGGEG